MMSDKLIVPLLLAVVGITIFWITSSTLYSTLVFIPVVVASFIFYLKTSYKKAPEPDQVLPLYLGAIGLQLIHFTEEYLTDFTVILPELLGQDEYPLDYWIIFNMIAYCVFILGGIVLLKRIKALMIIPIFFILGGVIMNAIGHILISVYVGGYFPGLYTALIYLVIGPLLLKKIII